jgi:rod shape-determining protein MreD
MAIKAFLSATLVLISVVITTALLARLPLPGATPDAVLVTVLAIALAGGLRWGATCGFAAGLLLDLAPPSIVPVGTNAFILCAIGAVAGRWARSPNRGVGLTLMIVAGAAIAAQILRAGLGLMARDGRVDATATPWLMVTGMAYAVILAPFVIPLVSAGFERLRSSVDGPRAGHRRW